MLCFQLLKRIVGLSVCEGPGCKHRHMCSFLVAFRQALIRVSNTRRSVEEVTWDALRAYALRGSGGSSLLRQRDRTNVRCEGNHALISAIASSARCRRTLCIARSVSTQGIRRDASRSLCSCELHAHYSVPRECATHMYLDDPKRSISVLVARSQFGDDCSTRMHLRTARGSRPNAIHHGASHCDYCSLLSRRLHSLTQVCGLLRL